MKGRIERVEKDIHLLRWSRVVLVRDEADQ